MITPEDNIPVNEDAAEEQASQQDIQSDGIDDIPGSEEDQVASDLDNLSQADRASESSYTLNLGNDTTPEKSDK